MQKPNTVNKEKVLKPKITISTEAREQIELMKKMDFTIEGKQFRVAIKGKECDGFTYEVYFDHIKKNDFAIPLKDEDGPSIIIDPFSAFYMPSFSIDYLFDPDENSEGFTIKNSEQTQHQGKFWVKKEAKTPPLL